MKESDEKVAAEMQLARFAQKTHGLKMTEMHLRVLSLAEQTDKYFLLVLMDDMMDDLQRNGVRALGQNVQKLSKREALLVLSDLKRWWATEYCQNVVENCVRVVELQRRVAALEAENEGLRTQVNDGWTNRVTYENMVEKIAGYEDASERDNARNLIEPMLKRDMARKFREDIRRKMKEMYGDDGDGARTFNNYGTYNEVQRGGKSIVNMGVKD